MQLNVKIERGFFLFVILLLCSLLSFCTKGPPKPVTEVVSISELINQEKNPRRVASLNWVDLGKRELDQSHFERAAQKFGKAIEIDPKNPLAYFYLALTRYRLQRWNESIELFQRAFDLFSSEEGWKAETLAYQGEGFEKLGRLEDAKTKFEEALELDSNNLKAKEGLSRLIH